jgi:hypothetical protein
MADRSLYEPRAVTAVGGWLLLLCRLLILFHPLSLAITAANVLGSLAVRGAPVVLVLLLRLLVVALGVAAGRALQGGQPGAVTLAKVALAASALTDLFVYTTPYFPNNRPPGDTVFYAMASLLYHGLWIGYLMRSKRVRMTFG